MKLTLANLKLNDLQAELIDKLLEDTQISPESIDFDKSTHIMGLDVLDRINKQKSYETYMKNYGVYSKAVFETELYGK